MALAQDTEEACLFNSGRPIDTIEVACADLAITPGQLTCSAECRAAWQLLSRDCVNTLASGANLGATYRATFAACSIAYTQTPFEDARGAATPTAVPTPAATVRATTRPSVAPTRAQEAQGAPLEGAPTSVAGGTGGEVAVSEIAPTANASCNENRTFEIQVDVGNATLEEQAANAAQEAADVLQGVPELQGLVSEEELTQALELGIKTDDEIIQEASAGGTGPCAATVTTSTGSSRKLLSNGPCGEL